VSVQVRFARPEEAPGLLHAFEWLFAPPGSRPPSWEPARARAVLAEVTAAEDSAVLVAEAPDGSLAGICTVYRDIRSVRYGDRAWVEDLAVDPGRRSQGVGKALLDAAKDWAREHGATHLELDSSTTRSDAHRFYEREQPTWRSLCYAWKL